MSDPTTHETVAGLVKAFANNNVGFGELVAAVWSEDGPTPATLAAAPVLIDHLDLVDDEHKGYLVILLGLLAESEYPATDGPVTTAVGAGLDVYLYLLGRTTPEQPLRLALLYLLEHLPVWRSRILAAVEGLELPPEEHSRLERALTALDPAAPDLGRVWPAPSIWARTEEEQAFDQAFIAGLTPEQIRTNWDNDTRTVYAYSGAKAYWAVRYGTPAPETATWTPPSDPAPPAPTSAVGDWHTEVYRCPGCATTGAISFSDARATCGGCSGTYAIADGIVDLSSGPAPVGSADADDSDATANLLSKLASMPGLGRYYEAVLRPAYLRLAGSNWGNQVTPTDEDEYIATHVSPVDGAVLDLAAGAGRWTRIVAGAVGAERVVALDMAPPMLAVMRSALPSVPAVLGSALDLPFDDTAFGAVNCWNALQAFPDDAADAILEMGRVLRPGGTLTMLTYSWDDDPVGKYFQAAHFFPSRPAGHLLFSLEELHAWFAAAGLRIVDMQRPGTFVLLTAERVA